MTTFLAKSLLKPHEPSWVIMSNYITIKQSRSDPKNLIIRGHHLIKSSRILILEKLLSKELYHTLISIRAYKVTPVTYFGTKCNANNLDWTKIFILPRLTTYNTYLRSFQYKILHNILFLNKKLYFSGITKSPLCSYCNTNDETPIHLFCECNSTKSLWLQLNRHLHSDLKFPELTPQAMYNIAGHHMPFLAYLMIL